MATESVKEENKEQILYLTDGVEKIKAEITFMIEQSDSKEEIYQKLTTMPWTKDFYESHISFIYTSVVPAPIFAQILSEIFEGRSQMEIYQTIKSGYVYMGREKESPKDDDIRMNWVMMAC